jgi:hypothetical protein
VRRHSLVRELESHLIVALAGAAMSQGVRAFEQSNLDLMLSDDRSAIDVPRRYFRS